VDQARLAQAADVSLIDERASLVALSHNAESSILQARLSAAEELAKRSTSLQAEVSTLKQQLDEVRSNSDRVILEQVLEFRE